MPTTKLVKEKHLSQEGLALFNKSRRLNKRQWDVRHKDPYRITASTVPTILGANPWKSPFSEYHERMQQIMYPNRDSMTVPTNWPMILGHAIEPAIDDWLREQRDDIQFVDPGSYRMWEHPDHEWFACTPDRLMMDLHTERIGVGEYKSTNAFSVSADDWKDGTVPLTAQLQVQTQMMILELEWAMVIGVVGTREPVVVKVPAHEKAQKIIRDEVLRFRERLESAEEPPIDGSESTEETIRKLYEYNEIEDYVKTDAPEVMQAMADYQEAKDKIKEWEERKKKAGIFIKNTIGIKSGVQWGTGATAVRYSWKTHNQQCLKKGLSVADIPEEYRSFRTVRTLRKEKIREGKNR